MQVILSSLTSSHIGTCVVRGQRTIAIAQYVSVHELWCSVLSEPPAVSGLQASPFCRHINKY